VKRNQEINGLKIGDWEIDLFPAEGGRLGITVCRGTCADPENDARPWADIYVEEAEGNVNVIVQ
jgi:hypothetical protein